jgi:FtsZ-interacting cell division protein YlmF
MSLGELLVSGEAAAIVGRQQQQAMAYAARLALASPKDFDEAMKS